MDASKLQRLWTEHGDRVLRFAVLLMGVLAVAYMGYHFWRLLIQTDPAAAVDLKFRYGEVAAWFEGRPVYLEIGSAVYPPASYAILWTLLGWLPLAGARWFWGITSAFALGGLSYMCVRGSGADTFPERAFAALMPLSMYATGVTVGNGQLLVHFLPILVAGLFLFDGRETNWRKDIAAAFLVILGFVKPSVAAPFIWIVLFVPNRLRPFVLVCAGYFALSLLAAIFQESGLISLMHDWLQHAQIGVRAGAEYVIKNQGYTNLASWLAAMGLRKWATTAALTAAIIFGLWTYRHRYADVWTLIGVTAIVARFWTYHLRYDDLLILLPMIAFFRIAKGRSSFGGGTYTGGLLLVMTYFTMIAPGGTNFLPVPWKNIYVVMQIIIWLAGLVFLIHHAHYERDERMRKNQLANTNTC